MTLNRHLIVVSVDAMVYEDLALLKELPAMKRIITEGSLVRHMKTIYPSLTHPVHATLMSGCAPNRTGVPNNFLFIPGKQDLPWFNYMSQMKCETIFHAAHRAGLRTAACRWPMTAGGFDVIDYLVPEVEGCDEQLEPDREKLYQKVCSPEIFENAVKPYLPYVIGKDRYPAYEDLSIASAIAIIRQFKPNLLLTHPCLVDHNRHISGLHSNLVEDALRKTDEWIGMLLQAVEDAGIQDSTSFCIVSDHGHLEYTRSIALNVYFRDCGLIQVDEKGDVVDWDAYCMSSGLSAQIYVKNTNRVAEIGELLKKMSAAGLYGFTEVLTAQEAKERYNLTGEFAFVVDTDGCTSFSSNWNGPLVRVNQGAESGKHHSSHGHMPEKGPQPPMIVYGPAFRKGVCLDDGNILDEAPTFAAALGLELPQAQGKPIKELLLR